MGLYAWFYDVQIRHRVRLDTRIINTRLKSINTLRIQGAVLSTASVYVQYVNKSLIYALHKCERNSLKVTEAKNIEINKTGKLNDSTT
jgi:hypothetical protein